MRRNSAMSPGRACIPDTYPVNTQSDVDFLPLAADHRREQQRSLQMRTLMACCVMAVVLAVMDNWHQHFPLAASGLAMGVGLAGMAVLVYRRSATDPAELILVLAASVWVFGKFDAYGIEGLGWGCASIILVSLLSPSPSPRAALRALFICGVALVAIWASLAFRAAIVATLMTVFVATITHVYTISFDRDRRAMFRQQRRLDRLLRCTDVGILEWDGKHPPYFSPRLCEMLGLDPDTPSGHGDFWSYVHPQHVKTARTLFQREAKAVTAPFESLAMQSMEFPLVSLHGQVTWVNAKAIRVSDGEGQLTWLVCTLVDISERKKVEDALRDSNAVITAQTLEITQQQHAKMTKALLGREAVERIARHDLKTPLNNIASMLERIRMLHPYGKEEDAILQAIAETAKRALDMLQLSMDFGRMEDGQYEFVPSSVDVAEIAETVCSTLQRHAQSKHLSIALKRAAHPCVANADWVLCETIVENLLRNAIEASPEGDQITVDVFAGDKVGISIHNRGAVPESVRKTFFHKYSTTGKVGGNGLGTYSAWVMARAQGGNVQMQTSETLGTTLTVELKRPEGRVDWRGPRGAPARRQGHSDFTSSDFGVTAPTAPSVLSALSVLVVDDDDYNAMWMADVISKFAKVAVAVNGRAAVDAVRAHRPDVIFMDLEMPVMSGFEAVGVIRSQQAAAGQAPSRIIAFTAHDDTATQRKCAMAGFDAILSKPASRDAIATLLKGAVSADGSAAV